MRVDWELSEEAFDRERYSPPTDEFELHALDDLSIVLKFVLGLEFGEEAGREPGQEPD